MDLKSVAMPKEEDLMTMLWPITRPSQKTLYDSVWQWETSKVVFMPITIWKATIGTTIRPTKTGSTMTWLNCLALNPTDFGTDGPGWNHELANNLGFAAKAKELANIDKNRCVLKTNYFDLNINVTATDFLSLDEALLTAPRQADGSLPNTHFLKLAPSSKLINAGTDIGFPFKGKAPDFGCFEFDGSALAPKEFKANQGFLIF